MNRNHVERSGGKRNGNCRSALSFRLIHLLNLLAISAATAAPLDDHIAGFKAAPTQTEAAVLKILQAGLTENRSALAFAAVKPWLTANPSSSQAVLFEAGQVAERAGDWPAAVSFYRKLLRNPAVDARLAAEAAPMAYRLLINQLGDIEAAYLLMREDGDRLRVFGRVRQFDEWFLQQAIGRGDLIAAASRLTAIHNSTDPADSAARFTASLNALLRELETFNHGGDDLSAALKSLAGARQTTPQVKARLLWVTEIVPCTAKVAELTAARTKVPDDLFDGPLRAAEALVAALPYQGSVIAAEGWMHFNAGDSGVFANLVAPRREAKAAPLLKALRSLPADQARNLLGHQVAAARGRRVGDYLFSRSELRDLVKQVPAVFNSLAAPDVQLFDNTLTLEEAKLLAPHLARNPGGQAALVRAFATAGEFKFSKLTAELMKSEMWRFAEAKTAVDTAWNSGAERDVPHADILKLYSKPDARYEQLKKQLNKQAGSGDRLAAHDALKSDLLGASPNIPGALTLWDELFANAAEADAAKMLMPLFADFQGDREYLLRRALPGSKAGGHALYWRPAWDDNFMVNGPQRARYYAGAAPLAAGLQPILSAQARAGELSEILFGVWLHAADPQDAAARTLMAQLAASPAYAKVDPAYHRVASDSNHFGSLAMTPAMAATEPSMVSRELLELPQDATPAQVEAAFKTVIDRVSTAPTPVTVIGLQKVADLPEWSGPVRSMAQSLFKENSPIGGCPNRQGWEPIARHLTKDIQDSKQWGAIEPFAAGLWHAAAATDDDRFYRAAEDLSRFAEAALAADAASVAMSVARSGLQSAAVRALAARSEPNLAQLHGRLRQTAGNAAVAIGVVEIPVDETDPAYPIYKANAEFVQGNLDSAWSLYLAHADQLQPVLRSLSVDFGFWLLQRNTEQGRSAEAEELVKELTIWSRQAEGTFSLAQDARLKIAYADLAFQKGALPTARAWYRKVADAAEYQGTVMYLDAALGSVTVDRVSKNFASAMTELDKLMRLENPASRLRVHYARAEVFMDQESYKEALDAIDAVLRQQPKHPDALILRGKIQFQMRKLVEASEIELGPSQDDTVVVPGEAIKINLRDPTLSVSGVGADIEVEIRAKSGDQERVMLYQLGDNKEKFRAEVPTALGAPVPGDKILQVLGEDEIRFGYSQRFRAKMKDLPPDPDAVITVASDAHLAFTAGAFPPRAGERQLDIEELGLTTAQATLGTRTVRPGNPVYLRVTDPDRSMTPGVDQINVGLQTSSGDEIRRLVLEETGPFTGEFEAVVPTTGAQALAFASESAPGRDPNMAISSQDYPGWQGMVGDKETARTFGIDLNDNVALGKMAIDTGGAGQGLTHFVLQTSMNGSEWTTRARFPDDPAPWDGRPHISSFPTYSGGIGVSTPESRELPKDWQEKMELTSARASIAYLAGTVTGLSAPDLPVVNTGHPGYSALVRYRALFYQPAAAIRRFQLTGLQLTDDRGAIPTVFLLDGQPAGEQSDDPLTIGRELAPGLHTIEIWRNEGRANFLQRKPVLLCDESGKEALVPCPDSMFDPAKFPEGVRAAIPRPATVTKTAQGGFDVAFGDPTRARLVRLVIQGFEGLAPTVHKVTLANRDGVQLLPVTRDYMALRENTQLEVLPGDQIIARYQDPVSATPKRTRHEQRLTVAFNDATITASFLTYETNKEGERTLVLEPIRRFRFDDPVAIIIDDADMDASPQRDSVDITVTSSGGATATIKALETEEHSGRFMGRVFPVSEKPSRSSEIQMEAGGSITATYRDAENLNPGIPTDRSVTIAHARYAPPAIAGYNLSSEPLPESKPVESSPPAAGSAKPQVPGAEVVQPRRELSYTFVDEAGGLQGTALNAVAGATVRFDVVAPHLALAGSSEITAYVQTDAGRKAAKDGVKTPFDVSVPGTLKLTGTLSGGAVEAPGGYRIGKGPLPPTNAPPLEEGRFSFSVPLILGDLPNRSFATKAAEALTDSSIPDGLAARAGDVVHIGYAYKDAQDQVQWKTVDFKVGSHAFLDVMDGGYSQALNRAFVGEKIHIRLLDYGQDRGPEHDVATVSIKGSSGTTTTYELQETEAHSGIFKGVFALSYADDELPATLPPVALNGFPVRYGDDVVISHAASGGSPAQSHMLTVNMGADGSIQPFSKRFSGDEMAVKTGFTLAECFFELAKKHRTMDQESLARREMAQARKLLAEAIATHRDDDLRAHAEYLLGNLAQEYADLSKNEEAKLPLYQDALARFSKIPSDYPDSEFAPKAQFKTALTYEKMGEIENSVEEYVKLAYKYPDNELIPSVMSRLGGYFQNKGLDFKKQADPLRDKEDDASKAEVLRLDELSYPEFLNSAMVFSKLQQRFPDDPLAGLAGLRAAQNFMRAHQYENAIRGFEVVVANEDYDGREIRSQALYWSGLSYERVAATMAGNMVGNSMEKAYQLYRRVTFDFPDSIWAKYARGRLADPAFEVIVEREALERERMIEALKESRKR